MVPRIQSTFANTISTTIFITMKLISLMLSTLLLAACGGGGGGGTAVPAGPVASTSTFQLKQAFTNDFFDTKTYPFTFGGTVTSGANTGTVTGNGTIAQSAISNVTFEGAAALCKTRTTSGSITVTVGASSTTQALTPSLSATYTTLATYLVGFTSATSYSITAAPVILPVAAKVGDAGTVGILTTYASAAKGPVQSINILSWALGADTASTAIFTLAQTIQNPGGIVTATQIDSYRLTPAGAVTPINAVATVAGAGTLTFTF